MCVVDNLPSTDHDAVRFMLNIVLPSQSPCRRVLYDYKKADMSVFLETLSHIPWHIIENATDIEESWQLFKDLLFSVVDMTIPRFKWKKRKLKHWFSYETIHLIRQNDACICVLSHPPHHHYSVSIAPSLILFVV